MEPAWDIQLTRSELENLIGALEFRKDEGVYHNHENYLTSEHTSKVDGRLLEKLEDLLYSLPEWA